MNRSTRPLALAAAALMLFGGCSAGSTQSTPAAPSSSAGGAGVLDRLGVQGKDAVATIDALDRSTDPRPIEGLQASVKADRLVITDDAGERSLPIPADKFYLSIAPYLQTTHDCFAHSLSGCQGEQVDKEMHITIVDGAGKKLVDKDVTTAGNGFVGFWLPRDTSGSVTATMGDKSGTVPFSTGADSPTCLTTLRMS
ncbi:MAG: CueP family metal-binding protein [Luteococcus japonicus]|uniref:CueP family metal-binding protein n=1 Tax=Luteococcus sp. TaxID=1969402 RepID=UPI0026472371|nr:CueP family metal-binding protein [Luteococcus sp.]MDN5563079.1 CueP family metal-binding protein [Luteococcus sp.]